MADSQMNVKGNSTTSTMGQILWRLVTSAVVLAITAFFTPGFSINNIWTLGIAAVVLTRSAGSSSGQSYVQNAVKEIVRLEEEKVKKP